MNTLDNRIDLLDHGYIRLVDHMGDDLTVVRRARHMPDGAWRDLTQALNDERLINYLVRNKHTSPFEFVEFDFHVKLPIFVARQWMRHRTWNFNEISARYQELPAEFYVPAPEDVGVTGALNRQGRIMLDHYDPNSVIPGMISQAATEAFKTYRNLILEGCPRELARCVLPLSTYTEMSAKVDLHNLIQFLRQRLDNHAQYEIQVYAEAVLELIRPIVPVCINAWLSQ